MTDNELDNALNLACAEKVMGWREIKVASHLSPRWYDSDSGKEFICYPSDFTPATSLADAARCTDAMIARGWCGTMEMDTDGYFVMLTKPFGVKVTANHKNEATARATAALAAAMYDARIVKRRQEMESFVD